MRFVQILPIIFLAFIDKIAQGAVIRPVFTEGSFCSVHILGNVENGDAKIFEDIINQLSTKSCNTYAVYLSSPGGSVLESMELGKFIRTLGGYVSVLTRNDGGQGCFSSCVLILAGGSARILGSDTIVGIHRPRFDYEVFSGLSPQQAKNTYADMSALVQSYLQRMGISDGLYQEMLAIPSNKMKILTYMEMKQWHLDGEDPGYAEWLRARKIEQFGETAVIQHDQYVEESFAFFRECLASPGQSGDLCAAETDKRFRNPLASTTKFRLVPSEFAPVFDEQPNPK